MSTPLVAVVGAGAPRTSVLEAIEKAGARAYPSLSGEMEDRFEALVIDVGNTPEDFVSFVRQLLADPARRGIPRLVVAEGALDVGRVSALGEPAVVAVDGNIYRAVASLVEEAWAKRRARIVDQEAANFSHDVRVLLGLIVVYASNLRDRIVGPLTEAQHAHSTNIVEAATSVTSLVARHVAALRSRRSSTSQRPVAKRRHVDLTELARNTSDMFDNIAKAKSISVIVPTGEPVRAWCDGMQVKQALVNLIANALKFTPPGGSVEVHVVEEFDSNAVVLSVSDTGPGVPPSERKRIFERGVRLERDRASAGTGIGLAVVASVAEQHGGAATVEATPSGGARFVLRLPADRRAAPISEGRPRARMPSNAE